MIPKVLHRVWVGPKPIPRQSEKWWGRFGELHPGWGLRTWRSADPTQFELGHLFASAGSPAQLADLMRIEILWREGGVYVDSDVEPIRPLDAILDNQLVIATIEGGWCLQTAVIGSEPGHPGLRAIMDELVPLDRLPDGVGPNESTGPVLVNRMLAERRDVTVVEPATFYPYSWEEAPQPPTERTLAVHHWDASWVPKEPSRARVQLGRLARQITRR